MSNLLSQYEDIDHRFTLSRQEGYNEGYADGKKKAGAAPLGLESQLYADRATAVLSFPNASRWLLVSATLNALLIALILCLVAR